MIQISEHFILRTLVVSARRARHAPAAAHAGLQHHAPAHGHVGRHRGRHFAGDVAARDVRHGSRDVWQSAALPQIEVVERTGSHADEDFPGIELRVGRVLVTEDLRPAVRMKTNSAHKRLVNWRVGELVNCWCRNS